MATHQQQERGERRERGYHSHTSPDPPLPSPLFPPQTAVGPPAMSIEFISRVHMYARRKAGTAQAWHPQQCMAPAPTETTH
mmetsp:Transcript_5004/g.11702  ORF Transcript_5004/g.11702 Transcript_5004/m.11702 type:complete len:81 (+) Transcript_5004:286-528(+)